MLGGIVDQKQKSTAEYVVLNAMPDVGLWRPMHSD